MSGPVSTPDALRTFSTKRVFDFARKSIWFDPLIHSSYGMYSNIDYSSYDRMIV